MCVVTELVMAEGSGPGICPPDCATWPEPWSLRTVSTGCAAEALDIVHRAGAKVTTVSAINLLMCNYFYTNLMRHRDSSESARQLLLRQHTLQLYLWEAGGEHS